MAHAGAALRSRLQLPPPDKPDGGLTQGDDLSLPPEPVAPDLAFMREAGRLVTEHPAPATDSHGGRSSFSQDTPRDSFGWHADLRRSLHAIVAQQHASTLRLLENYRQLALAQIDEALLASGAGGAVYTTPRRQGSESLPLAVRIISSSSAASVRSGQVPMALDPCPENEGCAVPFAGGPSDKKPEDQCERISFGSRPSHQRKFKRGESFIGKVADRVLGDIDSKVGDDFLNRVTGLGVDPSSRLDSIVGMIVMLNTIYIVIELQHVGYESAIALDLQVDDGGWTGAATVFFLTDHVFNSLYLVEMLLRLWRLQSVWSLWRSHWFDLALVLSSSVDLYILQPLDAGVGTLNILRVVRVLKVLRALRVARLMSLFGELRILVTTVYGCFRALFWSMVLLSMIMTMSGMFMCRLLQSFVLDESRDYSHRVWVWRYYGSSFRAIYTMFEVTLAGCWPQYVRPVLDNVSPWYAIFFMSYVAGVVFAVIRIITAIFLKRTLQVASQDEELMICEKLKERDRILRKLKIFFEEADASGDGAISLDEFEKILSNPKVRSWFQLLELEFHEADHLFRLLDDGDGLITIDEFIEGLMRLKGHSWSIDVVTLQRDVARIGAALGRLVEEFHFKFGAGDTQPAQPPKKCKMVHAARSRLSARIASGRHGLHPQSDDQPGK